MADWYVYIMSNGAHTLYTGIQQNNPNWDDLSSRWDLARLFR